MILNVYGGILAPPSDDFAAVRDQRRSRALYLDIDLSIGRSLVGGTQLVLDCSGNSFYADKNPMLQGVATVHFQDTNFDRTSSPIFVEPGFIARFPFTQLLIENNPQPGRILRFHYGVDLGFVPGNAQVPDLYNSADVRPLVAGASVTFLSAAVNTKGFKLLSSWYASGAVTAGGNATMISAAVAPTALYQNDLVAMATPTIGTQFGYYMSGNLHIQAGKGLYGFLEAGTLGGNPQMSFWGVLNF